MLEGSQSHRRNAAVFRHRRDMRVEQSALKGFLK